MFHARHVFALYVFLSFALTPMPSSACGGFFCTTVPINQAAEQIVFRQQGNEVTAMVRILYSGNAEDFSWVVPVPDVPEISLGADATFNELDFATRPQFDLQVIGNVCPQDGVIFAESAAVDVADESASDGVLIEEELTIGPFDIDIVSSDNPDDMAIWLRDNGYLLNDRGLELIEPYVLAGMKFVAVKLQSGESSGSIQPLIMKYPSEKPMVPIRLTAIAAQQDMGVLVWVVNDARAVPENYEHVTPNYTKLDWYSGSFNAYVSYQNLITDAMNEAESGQGFATDYAGAITNEIRRGLTDASTVEANLVQLDTVSDDASYLSNSLLISTNPSAALASLQAILPLPEGRNTNLYFDSGELAAVYTAAELRDARIRVRESIVTRELEPIRNGVELLPEGAYITRLYTTISADEMTADPTFNYNSAMPEQPRTRTATLNASCENDVSHWSLTLGEGTGREGERVLEVSGQPIPVGVLPEPINDQPAAFLRQKTSADAAPELIYQVELNVLDIAADGSFGPVQSESNSDDGGFLGALGLGWFLLAVTALWTRHRGKFYYQDF